MSSPTMTERVFQKMVLHIAYSYGWHIAHFTPAQVRKDVWVTPQTGHTGFPDLVLARNGVVLIRELKTQRGVVSAGQTSWLKELGALADVWRPSDLAKIKRELR